jgi:hypothetical protein
MNEFPLYNQLSSQVSPYVPELTDAEKTNCVQTIKQLSLTEHEYIYILISCYQHEMNQNFSFIQSSNKKHLKYDLNQFPPRLQHILYQYILKHTSLKAN